ncbi:DUF3820 family protein [Neptunitalea lumnitzerae]|uniref:Cytoplasmic protein n=1 Tax=Neptunitalea lumnitzerae TaxID=2965509 RepID=A0ABQ5MM97_9FLAO|nr:DUF3820 family protein [Neptunitalea sp. Y10]GLB50507.1 hypothetical protein Y10_28750 [Neptunitalea sp. Y10]
MVDNREKLVELAYAKMPFGKYKGYYLVDIPEAYYLWFRQKGFPENKLGLQMQSMLEIKTNELEPLIRNVRKLYPKKV